MCERKSQSRTSSDVKFALVFSSVVSGALTETQRLYKNTNKGFLRATNTMKVFLINATNFSFSPSETNG